MSELTTEQLTQLYQDWSAMGEKREQERIIKLLESSRQPCDCGDACGQWDAGFDEAIALIKGEK
jgi:hypothetical protein